MSDSDVDDPHQYDDVLEPIHNAAFRGDLAALRRELEAGVSPDCVGSYGDALGEGSTVTPLLILCSNGRNYGPGFGGADDIRLQAVKILLAAGATPDHIEGLHNDSPLSIAASCAHPSVVKALIAAGADPTWADSLGWTALHSAVCEGSRNTQNSSCTVALLRAGADVNALFNKTYGGGYTPLRWCLHVTRHAYILPVLLRAGATFDMASIEGYSDRVGYAYLAKVHAAGGWKRYAQAHAARLAPIFAKVFPHARLPPELVSHIVSLWAHVGYY